MRDPDGTARMRALVSGALLAMLLIASPARAEVQLRQQLDASAYPMVRATVVTARPTSTPPVLKENGRPVTGLQAVNLGTSKSVVIAIDRSDSMHGKPLQDAVRAARRFLAVKEPDDRVAIVAFDSDAVRLTGFSTSSADAESALTSLASGTHRGTALYDAVALSASTLAKEPPGKRLILLLTDGRDVSSSTTLAAATRAARDVGAAIYAIGITGDQLTRAPLRQLATGTGGGSYLAESTGELTRIYTGVAAELRRTWRLEFATAARPGERLRLTASVPGQGRASVIYRLPAEHADEGGSSRRMLLPISVADAPLLPVGAGLLAGALILLAVFVATRRPAGAWARNRVDHHLGTAKPHKEPERHMPRPSEARARLAAWMERTLGRKRTWERVQSVLERADLPLRTAEFFYISAGFAIAALVVSLAVGLPTLLALAAGAGASFLPYAFVASKAKRRIRTFDEQLPDVLQMLAASLRAGHSLRQGIAALVEDSQPPMSTEFRRVLAEASLGRPVEDALTDMASRLRSADFDYVVSAITIQHEVGGALAGLLEMVGETVRARQQFRRKVRTLTSMGRMTAYVLVGLPFAIGGALALVNPGYLDPLFHTSTGHTIVYVGLAMMAIGTYFLRRTVSFKG